MENPDIKQWSKHRFDPMLGMDNFKECTICREAIDAKQFSEGSTICNNCLNRHRCNRALIEKFMAWSRTTKAYTSIQNLGTFYASKYSAPQIERLVLSAVVNKAERKPLLEALLKITGDAGDQLILTEAMEELSNLQDENETKEK